jgi:SPP1 family phage portal protein
MSVESKTMFGRQTIFTDVDVITADNVLAVLDRANAIHSRNHTAINTLYDYYKGNQAILAREKDIRPEINNKIVENRAYEIVSFKVGYLMGEPLLYVSRDDSQKNSEGIKLLNEFVFTEDKAAKDTELAEWFYICGTAYRLVLPNPSNEPDESPFNIYTLDPRNTMVIYHSGLGNTPMMGVTYVVAEDNSTIYSVYTKDMYYEIKDGFIVEDKTKAHSLGMVPIIEYPANTARLGAFEVVLPLLDALNEVASNRLDGVEQFIQALLVLKGVDMDSEDFKEMLALGGLKIPQDADVKYLVESLNQINTQKLVDHFYMSILTICSMPNRNGGLSTSDTGTAVIMRDGWYPAETSAKSVELMFVKSEKQFLRLAFKIANILRETDLTLPMVDVRFTRRNFENIQEKSQVLATMLANDKIHPLLAFTHCGMFSDPNVAYTESKLYYEEQEAKLESELAAINPEV